MIIKYKNIIKFFCICIYKKSLMVINNKLRSFYKYRWVVLIKVVLFNRSYCFFVVGYKFDFI